ncbi:MAG: GNAT family N-acetyltransferase [Candidatus Nanopelagicales bacterium]
MTIVVRRATDDDVVELARLRRRSHEERHEVDDDGEDAYVRDFAAWWSPRSDRFRAAVAVDGDRLVGMGFLAVVDRVPVPGDVGRHHGDIQSMYVVPEHRDAGVGGRIVRLLLDLAREAGCSRVEVHSGRRAVTFYEREGFARYERLLNQELDGS